MLIIVHKPLSRKFLTRDLRQVSWLVFCYEPSQPYQIKFADGSYNDGSQFDSNQEFTTFLSRKNQGVQLIDKNETINGK